MNHPYIRRQLCALERETRARAIADFFAEARARAVRLVDGQLGGESDADLFRFNVSNVLKPTAPAKKDGGYIDVHHCAVRGGLVFFTLVCGHVVRRTKRDALRAGRSPPRRVFCRECHSLGGAAAMLEGGVFPPLLPPAALPSAADLGNVVEVSYLAGPTGLPPSVGLRERLGTLVLPSGELVPLTVSDVLWTARMLDGEVSEGEGRVDERAAVLWTMAQRRYWGTADGTHPTPSALAGQRWTSTLEAFSQPINPRWAAGGEFCGPGGRFVGTSSCSAEALARRARVTAKRWDQLTEASRSVALAFAAGSLPNPIPGAINWAARSVSSSLPRVATPDSFNNAFYYSQGEASRTWGGAGMYVDPVTEQTFVATLLPGAQGLIDRILGGPQ